MPSTGIVCVDLQRERARARARERERERVCERERYIPPSDAFVGSEFHDGIFEIIHHNFELFDVFVVLAHRLLAQVRGTSSWHKFVAQVLQSQYPRIFTG
jgi:hypothetical protein